MLEYIRVAHLREGDLLGKTIYNDKLQVLLRYGNKLTRASIVAIKEQGYKGCYIETEEGSTREDLPLPEPLVDDTEKLVILKMIQDTYTNEEAFKNHYNKEFKEQRQHLEKLCENIVTEIKKKDATRDFIFELEDSRTTKNWLYYHVFNTCVISAGIAYKIGLNDTEVRNIAFAGLMHDIGLMTLPEGLINKKDITDEEREKLRTHPEVAFRLFQRLEYPVNVCYGIWQHHEKIDGTGYPHGLTGEKIHLSAQIVALASAFDNLVSIQGYNDNPMLQSEALEYLQGCNLYSVDCLRGLLEFIVPYPHGTKVKLSNGEIGVIAKNVSGCVMRPYVLVGTHIYDLAYDRNNLGITITEIIKER